MRWGAMASLGIALLSFMLSPCHAVIVTSSGTYHLVGAPLDDLEPIPGLDHPFIFISAALSVSATMPTWTIESGQVAVGASARVNNISLSQSITNVPFGNCKTCPYFDVFSVWGPEWTIAVILTAGVAFGGPATNIVALLDIRLPDGVSLVPSPVPLPPSWPLFVAGVVLLGLYRARRLPLPAALPLFTIGLDVVGLLGGRTKRGLHLRPSG